MEPWNRINIPCPPGASIQVQLTSKQVENLNGLLMENAKVLKLLQGNALQTESTVLQKLLYLRNNSMRRQKPFQRLKQVQQCIKRLKNMKLDDALQDFQMSVCIKTGVCDVPSQPMLELICLKVLGASKLLSCTSTRCIKAFVLFKRHMKWGELINVHVMTTSMLSRLWVIFRAILVGLNNLHQNLLEFLKDVAQAQPMPNLTDTTLPADLAEFPGPSDASLLRSPNIKPTFDKVKSASKDLRKKQRLRK